MNTLQARGLALRCNTKMAVRGLLAPVYFAYSSEASVSSRRREGQDRQEEEEM